MRRKHDHAALLKYMRMLDNGYSIHYIHKKFGINSEQLSRTRELYLLNGNFRNEKVYKMLTARYRLHFSEGKKNVKFDRLRKHDQVKHYIYHVLRHEVPKAVS